MKAATRIMHQVVYVTHLEFLFLLLAEVHPIFLKFLPLHRRYRSHEKKIVKRDKVVFNLNLSDYMQWHVFAKQPDLAWKEADKFINDHSCMLDIGANCGAFALRVAQRANEKKCQNFKVYTFEPNPWVFQTLEKNLSLNPELMPRVILQQKGLGDKPGVFWMAFNKSNTGHGHIVSEPQEATFQIQIDTVDSFVSKHVEEKIDFIKIDVEGYEPLVLKGAEQTISKYKPTLYVEITETWFQKRNYTQTQIFNFLSSLGYQLYAEDKWGWKKINNSDTIFSSAQFNLLAINGH